MLCLSVLSVQVHCSGVSLCSYVLNAMPVIKDIKRDYKSPLYVGVYCVALFGV